MFQIRDCMSGRVVLWADDDRLSDRDLSGVCLEKLDFTGKEMSRTGFGQSHLTRINFCNAKLDEAEIRGEPTDALGLFQFELEKSRFLLVQAD